MHAVSEPTQKSCVVWMGRFPADFAACTVAATPKPPLADGAAVLLRAQGGFKDGTVGAGQYPRGNGHHCFGRSECRPGPT